MTTPEATAIVIDTITSSVDNIPATAPYVAGYDTGNGIEWTAANWDRFTGGKIHINQQGGSAATADQFLDIEALAWSIDQAVATAKNIQDTGGTPRLYISVSALTTLTAELQKEGVTKAFIWLANWNLNQAQATSTLETAGAYQIVMVQWASPSSNPNTLLPGTEMTLSEANCDLSVGLVSFLGEVIPVPAPDPIPDPAPTPVEETAMEVTLVGGRVDYVVAYLEANAGVTPVVNLIGIAGFREVSVLPPAEYAQHVVLGVSATSDALTVLAA